MSAWLPHRLTPSAAATVNTYPEVTSESWY